MADLTSAEMEPILMAHGIAEMRFDVEETMKTVVPDPHYEVATLGLAIKGRNAVIEMYRRLLAGNRARDFRIKVRVDAAGRNTLIQEACVSFRNLADERVTGVYLSVVEFCPDRRQIIGERIYGDAVWGQLWLENLGADFRDWPGVSQLQETLPTLGEEASFAAPDSARATC